MATNTITDRTDHHGHSDLGERTEHRRRATETKASTKTTEFFVYLGAVLAVAITALMVGNDAGGASSDPFSALDALGLITYLTIGYMIARGLAKSGSRESHDA